MCPGLWWGKSPEDGQISMDLRSNPEGAVRDVGLAGWTAMLHRLLVAVLCWAVHGQSPRALGAWEALDWSENHGVLAFVTKKPIFILFHWLKPG